MSLCVLPAQSARDFPNLSSANPVFTGERGKQFTLGSALPYLNNLVVCHFGAGMLIASTHSSNMVRSWRFISALLGTVRHIVEMGPQPKMIRSHAGRIVSSWAIVKNLQPIGNSTIDQLPDNPCNVDCSSVDAHQGPVISRVGASSPRPTAIGIWRLVDLQPDSFGQRGILSVSGTKTATESTFAYQNGSSTSNERRPTVFTGPFNEGRQSIIGGGHQRAPSGDPCPRPFLRCGGFIASIISGMNQSYAEFGDAPCR